MTSHVFVPASRYRKEMPPEQIIEIHALSRCGYSDHYIANELDMERRAVRSVLRVVCPETMIAKVQARAAEIRAARQEKWQSGVNEVLRELSSKAFTHIDDVIELKDGKVRVKDFEEMEPRAIAAIKKIKENLDRDGNPISREIEMHDSLAALKVLANYLGLERLAGQGQTDQEGMIAAVRSLVEHGVPVLLRDYVARLEREREVVRQLPSAEQSAEIVEADQATEAILEQTKPPEQENEHG
mgnify:CR=1 FL=1